MNLTLNDTVLISEGGLGEVCVTVAEPFYERERDIDILFSITPTSDTSGNLLLIIIRILHVPCLFSSSG